MSLIQDQGDSQIRRIHLYAVGDILRYMNNRDEHPYHGTCILLGGSRNPGGGELRSSLAAGINTNGTVCGSSLLLCLSALFNWTRQVSLECSSSWRSRCRVPAALFVNERRIISNQLGISAHEQLHAMRWYVTIIEGEAVSRSPWTLF